MGSNRFGIFQKDIIFAQYLGALLIGLLIKTKLLLPLIIYFIVKIMH
jgi:hypothetical protein